MTKFYSNKALSEKLRIPLTKVRRYASIILAPDKEVTLQSGKARKHNLRESFQIYLCSHMITKMGLTMNEVQTILKDIYIWLERNGVYPGGTRKGEPDEIVGYDYPDSEGEWHDGIAQIYHPIDINIYRTNTASGFIYRTIKEITRKKKKVKGRQIIKIQFEEGYIYAPNERYIIDSLNVYVLKITRLLGDFIMKIEGRQPF